MRAPGTRASSVGSTGQRSIAPQPSRAASPAGHRSARPPEDSRSAGMSLATTGLPGRERLEHRQAVAFAIRCQQQQIAPVVDRRAARRVRRTAARRNPRTPAPSMRWRVSGRSGEPDPHQPDPMSALPQRRRRSRSAGRAACAGMSLPTCSTSKTPRCGRQQLGGALARGFRAARRAGRDRSRSARPAAGTDRQA